MEERFDPQSFNWISRVLDRRIGETKIRFLNTGSLGRREENRRAPFISAASSSRQLGITLLPPVPALPKYGFMVGNVMDNPDAWGGRQCRLHEREAAG